MAAAGELWGAGRGTGGGARGGGELVGPAAAFALWAVSEPVSLRAGQSGLAHGAGALGREPAGAGAAGGLRPAGQPGQLFGGAESGGSGVSGGALWPARRRRIRGRRFFTGWPRTVRCGGRCRAWTGRSTAAGGRVRPTGRCVCIWVFICWRTSRWWHRSARGSFASAKPGSRSGSAGRPTWATVITARTMPFSRNSRPTGAAVGCGSSGWRRPPPAPCGWPPIWTLRP